MQAEICFDMAVPMRAFHRLRFKNPHPESAKGAVCGIKVSFVLGGTF
jgi:hypothetical protein